MRHFIRKLAGAAALACLAPSASAWVLDFDDLTGTELFTVPYRGFAFQAYTGTRTDPCPQCSGSWYWSDFNPDRVSYASSGNTSISTDYNSTLTAEFGNSLSISSATPFYFQGARFTALDDDIPVQFVLKLAGQVVGAGLSPSVALNYQQAPVFVASGYAGLVDEVQLSSYHGYFALDDFTYSTTAPVPEPATWLLTAAGLGGLAWRARRLERKG